MKNKHIMTIDLILIVATILALVGLASYAQPLVIAPLDDFETTNTSVLFEFERGNVILIDDNLEFSSPQKIYAEEDLIINLKPGKYYWKVEGVLDSKIRELNILSEVNLKLKSIEDKYGLFNAGNVELDVEIYNQNFLVGNIILNVDDTKEVYGNKFVAEQKRDENE